MFLFFVILFVQISSVSSQQINANDFVYYTQKSSFITEYEVPINDFGLKGITVDDRGYVWIYHSNNTSSKILKFDKESKQFTQYEIQGNTESTSVIVNLAGGQLVHEDSNIWFTDARTNSIGKLDSNTGQTELYKIPTTNSGPFGLAFEPNHNRLWFTELSSNKLGVLNIDTKSITEFRLKENSGPTFIAFDNSDNMWITQSYSGSILLTNPAKLVSNELSFQEFSLPKPDSFSPFGIAIVNSEKQRIALSDHGSNRVIISDLDSKLESYQSYWTSRSSVYPQTLPSQVVGDSLGNIFFAQHGGNRISMINTDNTVTEYEIPTGPLSTTVYLVASNNEVWFSEVLANKIGVLDLNNKIEIKIESSKNTISLDKEPASLEIFVKGKNSNILDNASISMIGMTETGIKGIKHSFMPETINLSDSTKSILNMSLQKNVQFGLYDAMIRVSSHESANKNLTISILKPISISINDLQEHSDTTQSSLNSVYDYKIIIIGIVITAGVLLLYRRFKQRAKISTVS